MKKTGQKAFDIFAHVTGLRQNRGVNYCEGDIEKSSDGFGKKSLSGAGRPNHYNIAFFDIRFVVTRLSKSFIVVIDSNREIFFSGFLPNDIAVQKIEYLFRLGNLFKIHIRSLSSRRDG